MLEKNCFTCDNAVPVEIQDTSCICKAGVGDKVGNDYWVNAEYQYGCDKYKNCEE